jgi:hypothetical protein
MEIKHFVGLDLGPASEYTALAVVERTQVPNPEGEEINLFSLGHLERFPIGTSYPDIGRRLEEILAKPGLADVHLVLDQTGVGESVANLVLPARFGGWTARVIVTNSHKATFEKGAWHVPRKEISGSLQLCFQSSRIKVPRSLPMAETLTRELLNFKLKVMPTPTDAYVAWREGSHDDLVLSVAIAVWQGERIDRYRIGAW